MTSGPVVTAERGWRWPAGVVVCLSRGGAGCADGRYRGTWEYGVFDDDDDGSRVAAGSTPRRFECAEPFSFVALARLQHWVARDVVVAGDTTSR
jgi:hypothetical protein